MWYSFRLLRMLARPMSNRIDALQKWVKRIENRSHGNAIAEVNLKQIKAKLAGLLEEEEAKADTSRRNCRITGFKFV